MTSAVIYGCSGTSLSREEAAFFADVRPWTDLAHVLMNVKEFIFLE